MLELRGVSTELGHADIDLTVRKGEIVGLYGLVGAGRTELAKCILGLHRDHRRRDRDRGRTPSASPPSPRRSIGCGIGYISEDRKQEGADPRP